MKDYLTLPANTLISPHFGVGEVFSSSTATRLSICNIPDTREEYGDVLKAATALAVHVLEPLRALVGKPILVNSWFRCRALNIAIGGSARSQHMTGEAADIHVEGLNTEVLFEVLRGSEIPYDQIIHERRERPRGGGSEWVHCSYDVESTQRLQALRSFRDGEYVVIA